VSGNDLRVSMSETIMLKTRSDRVQKQTRIWRSEESRKFLVCHTETCDASQRRQLCEQNGCVDAAQTERQESAAAVGYIRLAARKKQGTSFLKKTGDKKWIIYNNVKRFWGLKNSCPQTVAKQFRILPEKDDVVHGISKEWFIMSYSQRTKPSILPNTASNLIIWGRLFSRSSQNWLTGGAWLFITSGHIYLCAPAKNYIPGMFCRILRISPDLAPLDYHLFHFLQNSLDGKNFLNFCFGLHLTMFWLYNIN